MSGIKGQEYTSTYLDQEAAESDIRQALQALGRPAVPPGLTARLLVIASHERQRRLTRLSVAAFTRFWMSQFKLAFDNMMKPLALPVAGGSISAIALFGLLVPCLSFPHHFGDGFLSTYPDGTVVVVGSSGEYVPDPRFDIPRIERASYVTSDDADVVELTIDERGRVSDYSIERGRLTTDMQNIIMFSQFTPATLLGQPTSAKVKIVQRTVTPTRRTMRS